MEQRNVFTLIHENLEEVIKRRSSLGKSLWKDLLEQHPADVAGFLAEIDRDSMKKLFLKFPKRLMFNVFNELSDPLKAYCLSFLTEQDQIDVLHYADIDELTDLFDYFSDEELKRYINLLHKRSREKVLDLLKFHPESAGGIMDIEVLTLGEDYTVEKSIKILQRLRPDQEIYRQIYVTNKKHQLVGHINLEDLVVQSPKNKVSNFMKKNELVAQADEDQEAIAKQMVHYNLTTVPVVGKENYFLGVIPSETLMDVLVEEASEDVQKMAALAPMKQPYLETSFYKILLARSSILVVLLLFESTTGFIFDSFKEIPIYLMAFVAMLISTGGNTSHQTSALVLQGMASGELQKSNMFRFLRREFLMAFAMALVLGTAGFTRAYVTTGSFLASSIVGLTLSSIVMLAVILGSGIPLLLRRLNIDPAFSAGPFLATFMDILGVLIFCILIRAFLV